MMQSRNTSTLTERIAIYKFFQGKDLSGYGQVFLFRSFGLLLHKKRSIFLIRYAILKNVGAAKLPDLLDTVFYK